MVPIGEAADILGVSIDTIRRWDGSGILHSSRPDGKTRHFSVSELETVNDQLITEVRHLDEILRKIGFEEGLKTLKIAARELMEEENDY